MYNHSMLTRHRRKLAVLAALMLPGLAGPSGSSAQQTPPAAEKPADAARAALREELFRSLKQAHSEQEARTAEDQIWAFWMQGPDKEATEQIAAVLAARRVSDTDKALEIANSLVERYPTYAEAWNQKATLLFLKEEYDASLEAVDRVLALEPKHFGALAGKALILMRQGRVQLAQAALRQAVAIHPFLKERALLIKPPGTDL
jgi:Flp pilus assembly protein TadD